MSALRVHTMPAPVILLMSTTIVYPTALFSSWFETMSCLPIKNGSALYSTWSCFLSELLEISWWSSSFNAIGAWGQCDCRLKHSRSVLILFLCFKDSDQYVYYESRGSWSSCSRLLPARYCHSRRDKNLVFRFDSLQIRQLYSGNAAQSKLPSSSVSNDILSYAW